MLVAGLQHLLCLAPLATVVVVRQPTVYWLEAIGCVTQALELPNDDAH
jgi:hypothetical protein